MLEGVLSLLLLQLVQEREDYGYSLVVRLQQHGFEDLGEGTVYPALSRLEANRLLTSSLVRSASGPARKYYRLTDAGGVELSRALLSWHSLVDGVGHILPTPIPERTSSMNVIDRARIENAVQSYSFWLDWRGASGRRRRELRRELPANLVDAADHGGARDAVRHLGGTRRMAAEALPPDRAARAGPSVSTATAGAARPGPVVELLAALAWVDGVGPPIRRGRAGSLFLPRLPDGIPLA